MGSQERRGCRRGYPQSIIWVTLTTLGDGEAKNYTGLINDVCPQGLGIISAGSVVPGTRIEIFLEEENGEAPFKEGLLGVVCWCKSANWDIEAYNLGIKLLDPQRG